MKGLDINTEIWEDSAANCISWLCLLKKLLKTGEGEYPWTWKGRVKPSERHTDTDTPLPPRSTSTALCAAETATPAALVLPATYDTMLFWSQHHELLGRSIHCWHRPKEALLLLLLTNTTSTTTTTTTTFSVEPGKKHKAPSKWLCRV